MLSARAKIVCLRLVPLQKFSKILRCEAMKRLESQQQYFVGTSLLYREPVKLP